MSDDGIPRGLRTGVNTDSFHQALREAAGALNKAEVAHLFIGGVASMVHGRTSWTHDLDVMVAPHDQPIALEALLSAGFTEQPAPAGWLSKAAWEDVVVDIIHLATGPIYLDEEMLEHSVLECLWGTDVRVMGAEDLVLTKALACDEETAHYWWDALAVLAARPLDWEYLLRRSRRGPRRMLSLLLFAQSNDLAVPDTAVRQLLAMVMPDGATSGAIEKEAT